jgi:hypothetical protein
MTEQTQDKWTNHETYAVAIWLESDNDRHVYWQEQARKCRHDAPRVDVVVEGITPAEEAAKYFLSEQLMEEITKDAPNVFKKAYSDRLKSALTEVNWDEIADHYLALADETTPCFGPVIFSYSRAQAIADGVLVDVTKTAGEVGIKYHTAVTEAVWRKYVAVPEGVAGQDEQGRLWDILWMLRCAIVRDRGTEASRIDFQLLVRNDNRRPEKVTLKALCGPGDDAEPVITIMLPHED